MVKLAELKAIDDYLKLPKIEVGEVDLDGQWVVDSEDGPLSGVLLYKGKKYWYQAFDFFDEERGEYKYMRDRKYVVAELTAEQTAELEYWQELYRQKVMGHSDPNKPYKDRLKLKEMHDEFHKPYQVRRDNMLAEFLSNEAIGWFEL